MIGESGGCGGGGGGFGGEEEREREEERVVREEGGESLESCGVGEREAERERSSGSPVEVEPALGDQRNRGGRTWRKFLEDFLEKLVAEQVVHLSTTLSLSL